MSVYPGMSIKKYLGIVDVHVIRQIRIVGIDTEVPQLIEQVLEEVYEIVKARVIALGGNCLLGFKVDVNTLDQSIQT
jgi:hypothetical protein